MSYDFDENRYELETPSNKVLRIQELAHDLAWGAVHREWEQPFLYDGRWVVESDVINLYEKLLVKKWQNQAPTGYDLVSMGYLERSGAKFTLTPKAMELLEKPERSQKVFISYKQEKSSAFALLLEIRLQMVGVDVFYDKFLAGGQKWQEELDRRVSISDYFICLVAKTTLDSQPVRHEIELVKEPCKIICICHDGYRISDCPSKLTNFQGYEIQGQENPSKFEDAASFVLSACGYPTFTANRTNIDV